MENKPSILYYILQRCSAHDERTRIERDHLPLTQLATLAAIEYTPAVYELVRDWYLGRIDRAPPDEC